MRTIRPSIFCEKAKMLGKQVRVIFALLASNRLSSVILMGVMGVILLAGFLSRIHLVYPCGDGNGHTVYLKGIWEFRWILKKLS